MYSFIFFLLVFIFNIGCDESTSILNNDKVAKNKVLKIELLSPKAKSKIAYSYITLEIKVNSNEYIGIKNNTSFFIYDIALKKGKNILELTADNGNKITGTNSSSSKFKLSYGGVISYVLS